MIAIKNRQNEIVRDDERTMRNSKYAETVANHFDYHGSADFHNAKRHDGGTKYKLSIEESWRTTNWTLRIFSFILAITEVNLFLAMIF